MNVGLIGKGYWGKILLSKLDKIKYINIKFVCGSKDNYKSKLDLVNWVFIATPNDTHYDIVKHCILSNKNCINSGASSCLNDLDKLLCLRIDFIGDDSNNKQVENMRLLCPNCYLSFNGQFHNSKFFCK